MGQKGSRFERDICRKLSLWYTDGEDEDVFWRNRLRITKNTPKAEYQLGDIIAVKKIGIPVTDLFNIEVKRGYSKTKRGKRTKNIPWDVLDIIDGKDNKKVLIEFWKQTLRDSEISNRTPLLIFKRDYHSEVVCFDDCNYGVWKTIKDYIGTYNCSFVVVNNNRFNLTLISFDDFFCWLSSSVVKMVFDNGKF